ncbi:MAG: hypothetical protein JRF63_07665 [Deltaproteobacteria bacterium]|nr:hypothetical protein [Deltaproteobacteria bacterium]
MYNDWERSEDEQRRFLRLMRLFVDLPAPPDPGGHFPDYSKLKERFVAAFEQDDGDVLESRFLELYCHLHMHDVPYTREERRLVNETGGYWCHPGGLSPILRAGAFLRAETVSADYGAGNGLQGLLMQVLDPHARTIQIEISGEAVEIGQRLQSWLGVPEERVQWVVDDVRNIAPRSMDFIYLYRPLHPVGPGEAFYRAFAGELERSDRELVIFSVADCLRDYLSDRFEVVFGDGHLTCFSGPR